MKTHFQAVALRNVAAPPNTVDADRRASVKQPPATTTPVDTRGAQEITSYVTQSKQRSCHLWRQLLRCRVTAIYQHDGAPVLANVLCIAKPGIHGSTHAHARALLQTKALHADHFLRHTGEFRRRVALDVWCVFHDHHRISVVGLKRLKKFFNQLCDIDEIQHAQENAELT